MGKGSSGLQGKPHRRGRTLRCVYRNVGGPRAPRRRQEVLRKGSAAGRRERPHRDRQGHHRHGPHRSEGYRRPPQQDRRHRQQEETRRQRHHRGVLRSRQGRSHGQSPGDLRVRRKGPRHPPRAHVQHHQRRKARRRRPEDPGMHDPPRGSIQLLRVPQDGHRDLRLPQIHPQEEVRGQRHQRRRRGRIRTPCQHRRGGLRHHHGCHL